MPYRAWLLIFALGLIQSVGLGQAQEQSDSGQGQTSEQQGPPVQFPFPLQVQIIEDDAEADARRRKEAEANQREIDDLIAQQGMNEATKAMQRATEKMRQYSYVQTWLIGLGTLLVFATLVVTIRISRTQIESLERPILKIRMVQIVNAEAGIFAQVSIENNGDAIAEIWRSDLVTSLKGNRPIPKPYDFGSPTSEFWKKQILPGDFHNWKVAVASDEANLSVMGGIIYRKPGSKRTYRTFFCREYDSERGRFVAIKDDPEYERED